MQALAQSNDAPYILVLGIAQDGGYPQMGCNRKCCARTWENDSLKRWVVSLALVDPGSKKWWLFEATPDIREQLHYFQKLTQNGYSFLPAGIFITHAHIGHYTGLMQLGREVMNTKDVPVYTLPKFARFLETNGPWSQLVKLNNIALNPLSADSAIKLTESISVSAFAVPHRDEYSETAGFKIITGTKKYLFIPDINKWDLWGRNIVDEVKAADVALLEATFYDGTELAARSLATVPHPFVVETMKLFQNQDSATRSKIHFIHFNHTNPLLWDGGKRNEIEKAGYRLSDQGERL